MKKNNKMILIIVIFILALIVLSAFYNTFGKQFINNSSTSSDDVQQKQLAPDFTVKDINGQDVKLSDFQGKPVVINFWASWCPPCRGEMPDYNAMYKQYKDKVIFLMINMTDGQRETINVAKKYLSDNGYAFDIYFDVNFDASDAYGVTSIPESVFIDKDGYSISSYTGGIDKETIKSNIERLLK